MTTVEMFEMQLSFEYALRRGRLCLSHIMSISFVFIFRVINGVLTLFTRFDINDAKRH